MCLSQRCHLTVSVSRVHDSQSSSVSRWQVEWQLEHAVSGAASPPQSCSRCLYLISERCEPPTPRKTQQKGSQIPLLCLGPLPKGWAQECIQSAGGSTSVSPPPNGKKTLTRVWQGPLGPRKLIPQRRTRFLQPASCELRQGSTLLPLLNLDKNRSCVFRLAVSR